MVVVDCPRHRLYIRFVTNNRDRWEPKIIGGPVPHGDIFLDIKVVSNRAIIEIADSKRIDRITFEVYLHSGRRKITIFAIDELKANIKHPYTFRLR